MNTAPIIVCDDDKDIAEVTRLILQTEGYDVRLAHSADELVDAVATLRPPLILVDLWMPGGGKDAVLRIREHHGDGVRIVLISALQGLEDAAAETGADGWIAKPFAMADLLAEVRRHVGA